MYCNNNMYRNVIKKSRDFYNNKFALAPIFIGLIIETRSLIIDRYYEQ